MQAAPPPPDEAAAAAHPHEPPPPPQPAAAPPPEASAPPTVAAAAAAAPRAAGPPASAPSLQQTKPSVAGQEESLAVLLWLFTNWKETYNALRVTLGFPDTLSLPQKLCQPYIFKDIAVSWLKRNSLVSSHEDALARWQNILRKDDLRLLKICLADNHGMFWNIKHPPASYAACYQRLRTFVHRSKKVYRDELQAVLYPVLVQLVIELIKYENGDGQKIAAAHSLLDSAKEEHCKEHGTEFLALRSIFKKEHLDESLAVRQTQTAVALSQASAQLLGDFIRDDCSRFSSNILMRVVYLMLKVQVKGGPPKRNPGLRGKPWSVTDSNDCTGFSGFVYAPPERRDPLSGAHAAAGGKAPPPLRNAAMWDEEVVKALKASEKKEAAGGVKSIWGAAEGGEGGEGGAAGGGREGDGKEEGGEKKKGKGKKRDREEGEEDGEGGGGGKAKDKPKKKTKKEEKEDRLRALREKSGKGPAAGAGGQAAREIPRLRLSDSVKEELVGVFAKRKAVSARELPSVCFYTVGNAGDGMNTAAISSDGRMVAACLEDSTISLWDVAKRKHAFNDTDAAERKAPPFGGEQGRHVSGEGEWEESSAWYRPFKAMSGHQGAVYGADITVGGQFVASCGEDCTVRLWSVETESNLLSLRGHNYPVWDVAWSQEGFYLASASYDGTARLWSMHHAHPLRIFVGHAADVECVCFHPNCNYVVTGGIDRTVRLWDASSGAVARTFKGHATGVTAVCVSSDGKTVASGGDNGEVFVWDLASEKRLLSLQGHGDAVTALDYCKGGGGLLASASVDCSIALWDAHGGSTAGAQQWALSDVAEEAAGGGGGGWGAGGGEEKVPALRRFRTKDTPVVNLRFGLSNLIFAVGAVEAPLGG